MTAATPGQAPGWAQFDALERVIESLARVMYAATIDIIRGEPESALRLLDEQLDGWDGAPWNTVETGTQWLERTRDKPLTAARQAAVAAQEPHAAPGIPLRSDAETAAMLRADLADAEAQLARWPKCPAGCSCRIGIEDDPDRNECGCDGPCNGEPQPAPGLAAERDGLRKALRAISLGIAEPSPKTVADNALNGRYFDPDTDAGVWSMSDPAEQVRLARQDRDQLRTAVLSLAAELENEAAHTLSREAAEAKRAAAQQLRKIAGPPA